MLELFPSLGLTSSVLMVNALNFRIIKRTLFAELRNAVPCEIELEAAHCVQPRISSGTPRTGPSDKLYVKYITVRTTERRWDLREPEDI